MAKIVGVRFKPAGKVYDFDGGAFVLSPGDRVVILSTQTPDNVLAVHGSLFAGATFSVNGTEHHLDSVD